MLRCADGSFYIGHTDDLEKRLAMHHEGTLGGYTAKRRPVTLVHAEMFDSRDEAFQRERQLKGWSRPKKVALTNQDWPLLQRLAASRTSRTSS